MGYVLLPSLLAWRWTKDDEMHLIRQRMLKTACLKGLLSMTVLAKKKNLKKAMAGQFFAENLCHHGLFPTLRCCKGQEPLRAG